MFPSQNMENPQGKKKLKKDSDTPMYGCITPSCRIFLLLLFVNVYIFWLEKLGHE